MRERSQTFRSLLHARLQLGTSTFLHRCFRAVLASLSCCLWEAANGSLTPTVVLALGYYNQELGIINLCDKRVILAHNFGASIPRSRTPIFWASTGWAKWQKMYDSVSCWLHDQKVKESGKSWGSIVFFEEMPSMTQRHPISPPPLKVLLPPNNASQVKKDFCFCFCFCFWVFFYRLIFSCLFCVSVCMPHAFSVSEGNLRESVISFYHVGLQE